MTRQEEKSVLLKDNGAYNFSFFIAPYMVNYLGEIKQTIEKPEVIVPHKYDDKKANCYKFLKDRKQYLLVAVKYLNGTDLLTHLL